MSEVSVHRHVQLRALECAEPGTSSELVRTTLRGIRRTIGTAKTQKAPATHDLIGGMMEIIPDTMIGLRDKALLALGFAAAFRRSELVALQVEDLIEVPDGLRVIVRHSKTDQEGAGQEIAIPRGYKLRPVEAAYTAPDTAIRCQATPGGQVGN